MNKHLTGRIRRHRESTIMSEECTRCQVIDLNFYTEFYVPPKHKYINRILLNFEG